jgi:hypothetical protein
MSTSGTRSGLCRDNPDPMRDMISLGHTARVPQNHTQQLPPGHFDLCLVTLTFSRGRAAVAQWDSGGQCGSSHGSFLTCGNSGLRSDGQGSGLPGGRFGSHHEADPHI